MNLAKLRPLRRVVLGVPSRDPNQFQSVCEEKFSTSLLLASCKTQLRACAGEKLSLSPSLFPQNVWRTSDCGNDRLLELQVLECEPLHCGLITVNTEIVLTRLNPETRSEDRNSSDNSDACVLMSDFAQGLGESFELGSLSENSCAVSTVLEAAITTDPSILDFPNTDNCNVIGLCKDAMKKCGLFSDSLATVGYVRNSSDASRSKCHKRAHGERVVRVKMIPGNEDGVLMLPVLWFNLTKSWKGLKPSCGNHITVKKYTIHSDQSNSDEIRLRSFSQSPSWKCELPYATTVHISPVVSPSYSQASSYGTILQKFFATPRHLRRGDIIAVSAAFDPELEIEAGELRAEKCGVVYFKVSRVSPEVPVALTFLADSKHTDLFQEGPVKSYIPRSMNRLGDKSQLLRGLSTQVSTIEEVVLPHLLKLSKRHAAHNTESPALLLTGPPGCGKTSVCEALATKLNVHFTKVNCYGLSGDTSASTEARIKAVMQGAVAHSPCVLELENIHSLGKDRDGHAEDPRVSGAFHSLVHDALSSSEWPVVVVATSAKSKMINPDLHGGFLHQFSVDVPNEKTRKQMLEDLLENYPSNSDVSVPYIAQRTAGFVLGDFIALFSRARQNAFARIVTHCKVGKHPLSIEEEKEIVSIGIPLVQEDFERALDKLQAAHSDAIGAPKIPDVKWDDVGGLADVKADILDTIQLPLQHPQLFAAGLRRSGVLLYGPPGTGKTLLAKAVATECSLNFLSVKGPELINMYVGQSEENVREVFSRARSATPCVIFFDELDSLAPNRGRSGDSGGVMDRVVSQLLAELDGLHRSCDVFVIGATNRPDLLDPALLRPGRFDKLLFLGVSEDKQAQLKILKALTRKFKLTADCDLDAVVARCPLSLTGADFYALCSDAMLNAMKREIEKLETGCGTDGRLLVSQEDFLHAVSDLVPSVSAEELQYYATLQQTLGTQKQTGALS